MVCKCKYDSNVGYINEYTGEQCHITRQCQNYHHVVFRIARRYVEYKILKKNKSTKSYIGFPDEGGEGEDNTSGGEHVEICRAGIVVFGLGNQSKHTTGSVIIHDRIEPWWFLLCTRGGIGRKSCSIIREKIQIA